jgi:hypothetical protein
LDEHNSLEMNRTTVTGPGQNDNVLPGTVTDNTELSEFPQANLSPHSTVTTSSDNTTQTHHDSAQQPELKGTNVPDEVVYDVDMLSSLDSDVNSAAMMRGDSRLGTPFVMVNGMTVVPDGIGETVNGSELSPSCTEDEWYYISQAVAAAASAVSQLEHAEESQSLALTTAMESYIDWPDEESDLE